MPRSRNAEGSQEGAGGFRRALLPAAQARLLSPGSASDAARTWPRFDALKFPLQRGGVLAQKLRPVRGRGLTPISRLGLPEDDLLRLQLERQAVSSAADLYRKIYLRG